MKKEFRNRGLTIPLLGCASPDQRLKGGKNGVRNGIPEQKATLIPLQIEIRVDTPGFSHDFRANNILRQNQVQE